MVSFFYVTNRNKIIIIKKYSSKIISTRFAAYVNYFIARNSAKPTTVCEKIGFGSKFYTLHIAKIFMPCPFTGRKMFCAGPNCLS